jgi:hypothetical protein
LYGVYTRNGHVLLAKVPFHKDDKLEGGQAVFSARGDFSGQWRCFPGKTKAPDGVPGSVPIDLEKQHIPFEVWFALKAMMVAETGQPMKEETS